ncbi:MAG: NAD(P)H-hydrate dehydratase [Bacteroidales bacterium]|nr:NAD(P)H-hydrate dehydratase [Bacteroidales bacterium]MDY0216852.1 NAD(P)H-hydrate dehydratase [Bacteroidales bacterium]
MYLPSIAQIREIDAFTIEREGITSIDLMERAALSCTKYILNNFPVQTSIFVFSGPGNNGGDGFAIARQLLWAGYEVKVYYNKDSKMSADCEYNYIQLKKHAPNVVENFDLETRVEFPDSSLVLDALFGTGISKPILGTFAKMVDTINNSNLDIISIDIPSGMHGDENPEMGVKIVKAKKTLSFEFYKYCFLLPESELFTGDIEILPIGLKAEEYFKNKEIQNFTITQKAVRKLLQTRLNHSHKGSNGRAMLIAGSKTMSGAAVLSSNACLKSGIGLLHVAVPESIRTVLQITSPEAIVHAHCDDKSFDFELLTQNNISSIAIGPGLGINAENQKTVQTLFDKFKGQLILDADALNIVSEHKSLLKQLPKNSILTPHPLEFDRLTKKHTNRAERLETLKTFCKEYQCYCLLKGAFTAISTPDGKLYFNTSGNSGMASGGSGDVLTGIILALTAQNYSPLEACILGVYIHGLAADIALKEGESIESLLPRDIINNLGKAFNQLRN